MSIVTKTALANFKQNRSRNILIGVAITLTAMLLTIVPTVIFGMVDVQFEAVDRVYPTFHAMLRDVDEKNAESMLEDEGLTKVGLREDAAYMTTGSPKVSIAMVCVDENTAAFNKMKLKEGKMPRTADEIVVSAGLLKAMGLEGGIGDRITIPFQAVEEGGLGFTQEKDFIISGMTKNSKEAKEKGLYSSLVSKEFTDEIIPEGEHRYRVYFRIADSERMTTDAIEEIIKGVGETYSVNKDNVVNNTEYLFANYVDPAMYSGMVILMIIIILAGVLTIYSIYYVSMMNKVQEYGKLKAIGATKRQLRQLVFREGLAVAVIAIPIGLVIGSLSGLFVIKKTVGVTDAANNVLAKEIRSILEAGEISFIKPWILLVAAAAALAAVGISLVRPMQIAAKISTIEAIRFQNTDKKRKKKERKGYDEMNIRKLTASNLGRNKRRTVITICTLGVTGILFIVIATILSCMNPEIMTREDIRSDILVSIDSSSGDKMHPEWERRNIQKNNPLTKELREQIAAIDGVKEIETSTAASAALPEFEEKDGTPLSVGFNGLSEKALKELDKYLKAGSLDDKKLADGTGIILNKVFLIGQSEKGWKIGDKLELEIYDGDETITKEFEIVALTEAPFSLAGDLNIPASVMYEMCENDVTEDLNIYTESGKAESVADTIKGYIDGQETLGMMTWQERLKTSKAQIGYMEFACYALLFVFGLISILNLVNTMINSVYVRRRELGVLQAIGLSGKQTIRMLQLEGLFYTAGTLLLSIGIGSMAGYGCFQWAKAESIMNIKIYHYPVVPALILAVVILLVQILITYLVNNNFKKQSLIDRVRFSE